VRGVDCLTDYYDVGQKRANLEQVQNAGVEVAADDLRFCDVDRLLDGVEAVFHLAGQPGVRGSWGEQFADYVKREVAKWGAEQVLWSPQRGDEDVQILAQ